MEDDLRSYLADQSAAISSSEDEDPQSLDHPEPTDDRDDEEMPEGEESPGDETDEETDEEEESDESEVSAGEIDPRLAEIERRAAAAEAKALALENQIAVDREYARLQARWAQMDPDDAEVEKRQMVQALANEQTAALKNENLTLRQQIERQRDLVEHKPKAIQFLAETHQLTAAERAQLERIDDPIVMKTLAEGFAGARKVASREARRAAKEQRLNGGRDRIGSSNGRSAAPPLKSTGNSLLDYNRQQAEARP